jgi:hypothetical protein
MSKPLVSACIEVLMASVTFPGEEERIKESLSTLLEELRGMAVEGCPVPRPPPNPEACEQTEAWKQLTRQFGAKVTIRQLKTIAAIVAENKKLIPPGRNEQRGKALLFQWFNDNWEHVCDIVPYVKIEDVRALESEESG